MGRITFQLQVEGPHRAGPGEPINILDIDAALAAVVAGMRARGFIVSEAGLSFAGPTTFSLDLTDPTTLAEYKDHFEQVATSPPTLADRADNLHPTTAGMDPAHGSDRSATTIEGVDAQARKILGQCCDKTCFVTLISPPLEGKDAQRAWFKEVGVVDGAAEEFLVDGVARLGAVLDGQHKAVLGSDSGASTAIPEFRRDLLDGYIDMFDDAELEPLHPSAGKGDGSGASTPTTSPSSAASSSTPSTSAPSESGSASSSGSIAEPSGSPAKSSIDSAPTEPSKPSSSSTSDGASSSSSPASDPPNPESGTSRAPTSSAAESKTPSSGPEGSEAAGEGGPDQGR